MKSKKVCQLAIVSSLAWGGFVPAVFGDGPADLEDLAEKARKAASDSAGKVKKGEKAEVKGKKGEKVEAPAAKKAKADPALRAQKLGLISKVSKDVSAVMNFTNGEKLWGEVEESEMGGIFLDLLAENEVDLSDPDSPGAMAASLFAEEFLLAVGPETSKQVDNLVSLSDLNDKYQMAMMVQMWTNDFGDGGMMMNGNPFGSMMQAINENPDFLVNLVAALEMPPVLMAARVSDDDARDEILATLEEGAGMALEMAESEELTFVKEAKVEVGGVTFAGLELNGKLLMDFAEEMEALDSLGDFVGPAGAEDMINSLKEKNLILVGGVSDEAVYLYLGSDTDSIPFAASEEESLASTEHLAFVDDYLDKNLVNVVWMNEDLVGSTMAYQSIFSNYIEGLRLGLKENENLGNTKKLMGLLTKVETLEKSYLSFNSHQAAASVSYMAGDGLYTESFGGIVEGYYDWETAHALGSDSGNTFLTVQGAFNPEASKVETEYFEAAGAAIYEAASLMSGLEESMMMDLEEFQEGFSLFDKKLKADALELWKAMKVSDTGLGNEFLFEMDLAGSMPTVPGIPEEMVEKGPAPRLSMVSPVTDREKLAQSWKQMDGSITKILKTISDEVGENIPMQKPMSSMNDGLKTWFFPIPMQTDDFVPSVTLNDEIMIMGTSKERSIALAELSKKSPENVKGVVMVMNFEPLQGFLSQWLELIAEDPESVLTDEDFLDFFVENEDTLKAVVKSMNEFDSVSVHTRVEEGQLRSSSHFKTK